MLSSNVTSTKLSNIARREAATITWQLTRSARNRTIIRAFSNSPVFRFSFSNRTNISTNCKNITKPLSHLFVLLTYLSPGFPHFGIEKIQGLFQGIFKDIFTFSRAFTRAIDKPFNSTVRIDFCGKLNIKHYNA